MKRRLPPLLVLGALLAAAGWVVPHLEVETDITRFFPEGDDPRIAQVARDVVTSELSRTISLTIGAPDEDQAAAAARELGERLTDDEDVAWVRFGPDEALQRAFYESYFPRRYAFAEGLETDEAALRARAAALKAQLALPTSPFTREIAAQDPFLLFPALLDRLSLDLRGTLRVHEGAFVTEDGAHGVVLLASRASPFEGAASARLLASIDAAFDAVDQAHEGGLSLEMSGVHRFAVEGETTTKADITRVSVAGTLGVLFFLFVVFRSPRYVLLGNVPLLAGVATALVVSYFAFDRIHGFTLAFGATLVGVVIDYVAHYLNHHVLSPHPDGPEATMKRIWPGLMLGGATTVAGIIGLAGTGYPAIQEMALFTSTGVLGGLIATRYAMPPFLPAKPVPTRLHRALADGLGRLMNVVAARRRVLLVIPLVVLLLVVGGIARLSFVDDVSVLNALDETLLAEDERVRERVARVDAGRFVVAFGEDLEAALAVNDRVHGELDAAIADGALLRQRSLAPLLPAAATQRARHEALSGDAGLPGRTFAALEAEGFVTELFAPFEASLGAPLEPLHREDLLGTPLEMMITPFVLDAADGAAVLTFVHGVDDPAALGARVDAIDGALFFDQRAYMAASYRSFRTSVQILLAVGLVLVFLMIFVRYRNLRETAAAFFPAVFAGAATLGAISLSGEPLSFIHIVTLLLVLSMGVDYGVFMVEAGRHPEGPTPTVVSLVVACASTVLSFGALAASGQPALHAMGLTTAVGVLLSLLFAPAAWLLLGPRASGAPRAVAERA